MINDLKHKQTRVTLIEATVAYYQGYHACLQDLRKMGTDVDEDALINVIDELNKRIIISLIKDAQRGRCYE